MGGSLARVRNDAVGNFEAVDIGLILLIAAEGIANGVGGETEESEEQKKRGERGPIVQATDTPGSAGTCKKPADGAVAEVQKNKNHRSEEQESLPKVTQDVVTHFVAEIREHLISGFLSQEERHHRRGLLRMTA